MPILGLLTAFPDVGGGGTLSSESVNVALNVTEAIHTLSVPQDVRDVYVEFSFFLLLSYPSSSLEKVQVRVTAKESCRCPSQYLNHHLHLLTNQEPSSSLLSFWRVGLLPGRTKVSLRLGRVGHHRIWKWGFLYFSG